MFRRDRLRKLREKAGYTHAEMAEKLDISVRQIARYELEDVNPTADILGRMADVFHVTSDYLLDLSDDPAPVLRIDNLTAKERHVLAALRRGEPLEAVRVIVSE